MNLVIIGEPQAEVSKIMSESFPSMSVFSYKTVKEFYDTAVTRSLVVHRFFIFQAGLDVSVVTDAELDDFLDLLQSTYPSAKVITFCKDRDMAEYLCQVLSDPGLCVHFCFKTLKGPILLDAVRLSAEELAARYASVVCRIKQDAVEEVLNGTVSSGGSVEEPIPGHVQGEQKRGLFRKVLGLGPKKKGALTNEDGRNINQRLPDTNGTSSGRVGAPDEPKSFLYVSPEEKDLLGEIPEGAVENPVGVVEPLENLSNSVMGTPSEPAGALDVSDIFSFGTTMGESSATVEDPVSGLFGELGDGYPEDEPEWCPTDKNEPVEEPEGIPEDVSGGGSEDEPEDDPAERLGNPVFVGCESERSPLDSGSSPDLYEMPSISDKLRDFAEVVSSSDLSGIDGDEPTHVHRERVIDSVAEPDTILDESVLLSEYERSLQPKIVERVIQVPVAGDSGPRFRNRNGVRLVIVSGDRRSGVSTLALTIARHFAKKEPTLLVDFDLERHGLLGYFDLDYLASMPEQISDGLNFVRSEALLSQCVAPERKTGISMLYSLYGTSVSTDSLLVLDSVLSKQKQFSTVVIDCPVEHLVRLQRCVAVGSVLFCMPSDFVGVVSSVQVLNSCADSEYFEQLLLDRLQYIPIGCKDFTDVMQDVADLFELDSSGSNWAAPAVLCALSDTASLFSALD